jgi:hypothetical protein
MCHRVGKVNLVITILKERIPFTLFIPSIFLSLQAWTVSTRLIVRIPKTDEDYEMDAEEGKRLMIAADLNELAYTGLICLLMTRQVMEMWLLI